ncbi:MAG: LLM class oxidoreductase [Bacteroidota bacterium]
MKCFETINKGFNQVFEPGRLSIGIVVPIENYANTAVPSLENHLESVRLVDQLGFKALWIRDVPFHVPSFGDAGQTFDPFTYMGYLAAQTQNIALGIASIALPLHHPVHVAKSAASIDQLSGGRLILGVASGDRFDEYPGMGIDYQDRGERFSAAFDYIRKAQEDFPNHSSPYYGHLQGQVNILPKAKAHKIPMLITGYSRQALDWNAENGDGWIYYPRNLYQQQHTIAQWRELVQQANPHDKPFMQPLYVDLHKDDDFTPQAIHLGFRTGIKPLIDYFYHLQSIGVNHVAINLRFNTRDIEETLSQLAEELFPHFHPQKSQKITL